MTHGALLRVHPSNFRDRGIHLHAVTADLGRVASRQSESILIEDLGSGALLDTAAFGLAHEPTVAEAIAAGAAIVTFSGDKLLGGPQAGIICGRADLIERIERHPLARAVRADKTTLAGVAATLRHYLAGDAETSTSGLDDDADHQSKNYGERRAVQVCNGAWIASIVDSISSIGGGVAPWRDATQCRCIASRPGSPTRLARRLRTGSPRVFPDHSGWCRLDRSANRATQPGRRDLAIGYLPGVLA